MNTQNYQSDKTLKPTTMKAVAYLRISVKDQSQYSLDYQEKSVRDYCVKNDLTLLDIFKDDGESSYTFDRPDWLKLEQFIKKNKGIDYLVVHDHDRFSRNLAEALMKIKELQETFGIKVLATSDNFDTDFSDPSTFLMRAFKYMMAEGELWRIRQRTKSGMVQAALNGRFVARAPWGYINSRDHEDKPLLKIDEEKAFVVRMIFREFTRGTGIEDIKRIVEPYGYKQSGNSSIQRILSNPVYAGMVRVPAHKNKPEHIGKAIHPPIVTETEYWQAQARLENRGINVQTKEDVPLRGLLKCHECGRTMTAGNSKGKMGKYYWYYLCNEHRKSLPAEKLHKQLNEILDLLSFEEKRLDWFAGKLGEEIAQQLSQRSEVSARTQKALRQVGEKIITTEEKYLTGDGISKSTFTRVMGTLKEQQIELQKRMNEINTDQTIYWKRLTDFLPTLRDLRAMYDKLDLQHRQTFLNMVFDASLSHDGLIYRTRFIHPMFSHNELILKEKGLLVIEQPFEENGNIPVCAPKGNAIELLSFFADLVA